MEIISIIINQNWDIQFYVSKFLIIFLIIIFLIFIYFKNKRLKFKDYEISEADIGIGNSNIKIKPNYEDIQIAYKLWIELSTRKIGIPIDFENDAIMELYNSWYEFFKISRELLKDIPIVKARKHESTSKLINITIEILNLSIRPHLTKWQAKFRKWYFFEIKKTENEKFSPQEIQKIYPDYNDLVKDMGKVNNKLIKYKNILKDIAFKV